MRVKHVYFGKNFAWSSVLRCQQLREIHVVFSSGISNRNSSWLHISCSTSERSHLIFNMHWFSKWCYLKVFVIFGMFCRNTLCEQFIQSISGTVGQGNYTYYSLKQEGTVTLIVESLLGDADIYVSCTIQKPDYMNYDLQSATCGQDIVTIPAEYTRPVGIAIYGHVYHPVSKYVLSVIVDWDSSKHEHISYSSAYANEHEEQQESIIWVVFVNIMKIIIEVLA